MDINKYIREYEKDFGKIENLENKIREIKSNNEVFLSQELIRKDLEEKGLKNWFLQDIIIFKYFGEVYHTPSSVPLNILDEKVSILYGYALGIFGDDLKRVLEENPAELFKEKVGEEKIKKDGLYQMTYKLLSSH